MTDNTLTDHELIQGFLAGKGSAYAEVKRWIEAIVRSRLWVDRVAPEDVVSETVMKLLKNLRANAFRGESSFKTYVQRVTLYTLVNATRNPKKFDPMIHDVQTNVTPYSLMIDHEEEQLLERALAKLSDGCKQLLAMTLDKKMKCKEIAGELGATEGAIKTRLSRCKDQLEEKYKELT